MDITTITPQIFIENEHFYISQLDDNATWNRIPFLNSNELHNFADQTLVRFRGMIQDMHGPEMYLERYEVVNEETRETKKKCGKFMDVADCHPHERIETEGPDCNFGERLSFAVVSPPGLNLWVRQLEEEQFKITLSKSQTITTQQKRPLDTDGNSMETSVQSSVDAKKPCASNNPVVSTPSSNNISPEHLLNCPLPDESAKACHLKIYKNDQTLKLNMLCDFVGFLSLNPILAQSDENNLDSQVHNPPPSLIPRLHCVSFKILPHDNPLYNGGLNVERMQYLKKELMILFTQLLCGDSLAAEMLIYNLISQVYIRTELMAIGQLSLNISNVPHFENGLDFIQEVYKFLQQMVTKSHYFPMSLDNMNETAFVPKKDYAEDRLTSSILQLSHNTHLILDETKLTPGKLNEAGVNGIKTLASAIRNQKINYNFTYFNLEFHCDIPFLIFSEGKSLLPCDWHVKLELDEMHLNTYSEIIEAAGHFLNPELLNEIRSYLTQARLSKYEIDDKTEMIENEYVKMRQNKANVTGDDLHRLLVLARLIATSQGKNTFEEDDWKRALTLDQALKERTDKK